MSSGTISQREFIALEKDLSLAITGDLDHASVAEKAIEIAVRISANGTQTDIRAAAPRIY